MSGTVSAGLDVTALTLEEFHRSEQDIIKTKERDTLTPYKELEIIQTEERDSLTSYQEVEDRFSKLFEHFDLDREEDGDI